VARLDATGVTVVEARAEEAARRADLREVFDAVVARSFGPPRSPPSVPSDSCGPEAGWS